ncbi:MULTISPECIES: RNA polymerase sigma factor [unclassified Microbacterium]|uniref:RNA polymerase sigma factor n=1 Tax=unclassified Microbacterium TaxID=2609290 RepID=UPI000DE53571|nr:MULTISPECIES: sigma-70 family RNA polymerase sigma factor [unclassified Microbacterium]NYF29974.1 RNA polymerase sigma-70 factor (ECF subfamily) [Microbacterium sp. JAI119]RBO74056.1 RNA polymerase subunit sigma-70 [Microbacterium sp. H6]
MTTDSEIIQRSLQHPAVFAELFDRHARAVNAFATYRIGRHAAEDVLSETFLVAFRRRADFDTDVESAAPWLLGIASRLIRRHRAVEAKHWRSFAASVSQQDHSSLGGLDDAMSRVDAEREVRSLKTRIAALAPKDRETLLLYAWQGLTYEEIAVALAVPVGTVRSRLNRVRTRLDSTRRIQAFEQQQKGETLGHV